MENDIKSLRRQLLKTEIEEQGLAVVAKKAGKPDRQINDMAAGRKTFGDKIARAIGPLIRPDLAPDWLLSPSSNTKKAPTTTQLPDSPTQQNAVPEQPPGIGEQPAQYRLDNPLSNDEREILALYRKLSADDKPRLLHYLEVKIELDQFPTSPNEPSEKPDSATPAGMRDAEPNLGPALVDLTGT